MQAPMADQNQESQSSLVTLSHDSSVAKYPLQNNPVREQAGQLWAILSQDDTATTYQQAAVKTWKLFKQAIILIFFLFVLLIALVFLLWGIGFQSGRQFRRWLEIKQPTLDDLLYIMLEIIVLPFKRAFEWANSFIKKYLGWEIQFDDLCPELVTANPQESNPAPSSTPSESPSSGQTSPTTTDHSSSSQG